MIYTKEFLIAELHRFVKENGRNPKQLDMQGKNYPNFTSYQNYFGSWNNALVAARLKINQKQTFSNLTGTETCDNCGKGKPVNQCWHYKNSQRLCLICLQNKNNHKNGGLDSNSKVGFAFISQRIVAKTLDLDLKDDCNCAIGFGAAYDLLDDGGYGTINVKASVLRLDNSWSFGLQNKEIPDTYILLGFSRDKSNIEHVWITNTLSTLVLNKQAISITNVINSGLKRARLWEVDAEPYNAMYHSMSLENCTVLRSD